jgi:hypothetical protein
MFLILVCLFLRYAVKIMSRNLTVREGEIICLTVRFLFVVNCSYVNNSAISLYSIIESMFPALTEITENAAYNT